MLQEPEFEGTGETRFFAMKSDEIFDTRHFTLIFINSDSVTNVTKLNRINKRRVLLFIGNLDGVISFGKGKAEDYEGAFEKAFKRLRTNLVCVPLDRRMSVTKRLKGQHNDFRIQIWP